MGCLNSILKMWPDKNFVQGGGEILGVRAASDRFRQNSIFTGFIGSADDIIFTTEPGV